MNYKYIIFTGAILAILSSVEARRRGDRGSKDSSTAGKDPDNMICPPCDRLYCPVKKAKSLKCVGGITTDICGCCPVCAKQLGDPCGGAWNYLGKCDVGLYCRAKVQTRIEPRQQLEYVIPRDIREGNCTILPDEQKYSGDQGGVENRHKLREFMECEPKCTPSFCRENPRAICSAVDVVDMRRDCFGKCQHTSCMACSFVDPDPDCGSCSPDNFKCIKQFAKCIKRDYCSRNKYPCKSASNYSESGKFQCMVPKCSPDL